MALFRKVAFTLVSAQIKELQIGAYLLLAAAKLGARLLQNSPNNEQQIIDDFVRCLFESRSDLRLARTERALLLGPPSSRATLATHASAFIGHCA